MLPNTNTQTISTEIAVAFAAAHTALHTATAVFFTTHQRTDGDDLGTVLALYHAYNGKQKGSIVAVKGGIPEQLLFMPGSSVVQPEIPMEFTPDVVVISGCSNFERTGLPTELLHAARVINIDHHPDNELFGEINIVDPRSSSVAELTYHFLEWAGIPISPEIATCLLTGIITDTGSFLHSNTAQSTLTTASQLMRRGARSALVAKYTSKGKDIAYLRAWSKALNNAWLDNEKKMICSIITAQDLEELGNPPLTAFEEVVETLNKVPEAAFALFLKQEGAIVKGSLRSDPDKHGGIDVGHLARLLGGGGHKHAAGFTIPGVLKKLDNNQWIIESMAVQATSDIFSD